MAIPKSSFSKMIEEDQMPESDVSREFINFFVNELKDIYWGEKQLSKTLLKMWKATATKTFKDTFAGHCTTTQLQVERLEEVFEILGETPKAQKCEAFAGLLEEVNSIIEETGKGTPLRDAGLIMTAQKIEHYEIATYKGLVQLARTLGNEDIIALLEETLSEEEAAVELLVGITEGTNSSPDELQVMEKQLTNVEKVAAVYDSANLIRKNTKK